MQKLTTFLWFNDQAEEAANFYVSIFKNSRVNNVHRSGEGAKGTALTVSFEGRYPVKRPGIYETVDFTARD